MGRRAIPTDLRSMHEFQFEVDPCSVDFGGKRVRALKASDVSEPSQAARAMLFPWRDGDVVHWLVHPKEAPGAPTRAEVAKMRKQVMILSCGMFPVESMKVVSACGIQLCANPDHLRFIEAPRKSAKRVLSDDQVAEIRRSHAKVRDLARRYGVNPGVVSAARNGRTYQYVKVYLDEEESDDQ